MRRAFDTPLSPRWQALLTFGTTAVVIATIALFRSRLLDDQFGEHISSGIIPLTEPPHSGCYLHLGVFYRVMHNLTTPAGLVLFGGISSAICAWAMKGRWSPRLVCPINIIANASFLLCWLASTFMPCWIFEVTIAR